MSRHKNVSNSRRKRLADPKRLRFGKVLEGMLNEPRNFVPDAKSDVAPEVQLANAKAARPFFFASRHVLDRHAERVLGKERPEPTPRPRVEKRRQARAAAKTAKAAAKTAKAAAPETEAQRKGNEIHAEIAADLA